MNLPAIGPNLVIILTLVLGGLYGLLAGKARLRTLILSVYVGIVLAKEFSSILAPMLSFLTIEQVTIGLLALPILVFGFARQHHGRGHIPKGVGIANIIVGILTGALIVAAALALIPTSSQAVVNGDSFIAIWLETYYLWLLGLLPVVALVLGLLKEKEHH